MFFPLKKVWAASAKLSKSCAWGSLPPAWPKSKPLTRVSSLLLRGRPASSRPSDLLKTDALNVRSSKEAKKSSSIFVKPGLVLDFTKAFWKESNTFAFITLLNIWSPKILCNLSIAKGSLNSFRVVSNNSDAYLLPGCLSILT